MNVYRVRILGRNEFGNADCKTIMISAEDWNHAFVKTMFMDLPHQLRQVEITLWMNGLDCANS